MHLVYDNAYIGYACAFNSQGDVTIHMEATGAPGWHFIDLYPGIYKGTETLPDQLPDAAAHLRGRPPGRRLAGVPFRLRGDVPDQRHVRAGLTTTQPADVALRLRAMVA